MSLSLQVMAFETDYGAVVSNTRYVEYLERGRYALFQAAGISINRFWDELGVQPVVRRYGVELRAPARYEDHLILEAWVQGHTGATTNLGFRLRHARTGAILMEAQQVLAYLNRDWRAVRIPTAYRDALTSDDAPAG